LVGNLAADAGGGAGGNNAEEPALHPNPRKRKIYPADCFDIAAEAASGELTYVGTSGLKITRMAPGFEGCGHLTQLCLRSNFVRKIEGLENLTNLTKLSLYENRLRRIEHVAHLTQLTELDLSYNRIRELGDELRALPRLTKLYVAVNKLGPRLGDGLAHAALANLTMVDLGDNGLREIGGLQCLVNLEELWLGRNKITKIEGLGALTKLAKLSVQSNRLTAIEGLDACAQLRELYLSHNGIERLGGLASLARLETLDVGSNKIAAVEGLAAQAGSLTELWMSGNAVASYDEVDKLAALTRLEGLYLEFNPIAKDFEYRMRLARTVPSLTRIDATQCRWPAAAAPAAAAAAAMGAGGGEGAGGEGGAPPGTGGGVD